MLPLLASSLAAPAGRPSVARRVGVLVALAALTGAVGCPADEAKVASSAGRPLRVATLSVPVDWLVATLTAGLDVKRELVPPLGEDPPFWRPEPARIAALADVDLIVANGAGYEAWTATAALPRARVVDSARGLDLLELNGVAHSHGGGAHSHAGTDPHTFADPVLFGAQADRIAEALERALPDKAAEVGRARDQLRGDLATLQVKLHSAVAGRPDVPTPSLAQSHPAFSYLARRLGLEVTTFLLDPEELPPPEVQQAVVAWARSHPRPVLLWEAPPRDEVKAALAGVEHAVLDPLEQPPAGGVYDYLAQARRNAEVLRELFLGAPGPPGP